MKYDEKQFEEIARNPVYHDLGTLPSQGIPYKGRMEKIFIRPFRLPEMRLLSKAAQLGELSHMIRAVDMTISYDVWDLTIGDFYYILLWLRMHSMPDSPYIIEWFCDQPFFRHKTTHEPLLYSDPNDKWPTMQALHENYTSEPCNSDNTSIVHFPTVEVIELAEDFVLDERFDFPRVNILENLNAALLDAEMVNLAPAIQWFKGATWAEKVEAANADESLNMFAAALKINKTVTHGIAEEVTFQCRKCRIEHTQTLKLSAITFFQ